MNVHELLGDAAPWPAPAKLNLCLHIVGRRGDGYHLLQSAIQFIDLQDELKFYRRPLGVIERIAGPENVPPMQDLAVRAARLLAANCFPMFGVGIELHKHIPMQAGLGGGSSDAATVLVALNHFWRSGLSVDALATLGLELGADVPVFIRGHAAWVEGIGEQLTPCDYEEACFLVIKPKAGIDTAEIFNASELTRNTPVMTIRALRGVQDITQAAAKADGLTWPGRNDCEAVVRRRYPEVARALDWLNGCAQLRFAGRLTGTGACVFAEFTSISAAQTALAQVPPEWRGYVVKGLNRSPLLERLAAECVTRDA